MSLTTSRSDVLQQLIDQNAIIIQQNQELAKLNKGMLQYFSGQAISASPSMFLDNCTDVAFNAPEGGNPMAYKRTRVRIGINADGSPKYTQISGNTEDERNDNIVRAYVNSGRVFEFIPSWALKQDGANVINKPEQLHPLKEVAWDWFDNYLPMLVQAKQMQESQLTTIKSHMSAHVIRYFGDTPVEHIKHSDAQSFLFSQINPKTEEYYAKKVIDHRKSVLHRILQYAVLKDYIPLNPMDKGKLFNPSDKEGTREALSKDELLQIRKAIPHLKTEQEQLYMILLTHLPYRRCEALGQRWEDIDFINKTCSVTGDVVVVKGKSEYHEGEAKNASSIRTMIATDTMMNALRPFKKDIGFVLNTNGKYLKASEIESLWESIASQIPLLKEKGITPYYFRHTIATIMYHETEDLLSVAKQCGHSNTKITAKVYVHDDIDHRRMTVERMEQGMC